MDGSGKRYLLGPLYMVMGDVQSALKSFCWFARSFPDDIGEPFHYLCWTLALYRSGNKKAASQKLRRTMLSNLYLIPHLLGLDQEELDIWHGTNLAQKSYLQYASPEILALWDPEAWQWASETYHSPDFQQLRERYIELLRQLKGEPVGPGRNRLVEEIRGLEEVG